jgi:hypothetical protein
MDMIRSILMGSLLVVTSVIIGMASTQQQNICDQGPAEIKPAGGTWFLRVAGGQWEHVGHRWELVEKLVANTPVELPFKTHRALLQAGGILGLGLGLLLYFWPTAACAIDREIGFYCDDTRALASGVAIGVSIYTLLKAEEWAHVKAVQSYNEMWELLCKGK